MKRTLLLFAAIFALTAIHAIAPEGVELVNLGLPSGLLWANMNVGATTPEEEGDFFAWGELAGGKTEYGSSNYTYAENPTTLPDSADAARINWGDDWRMPTDQELDELINECTWVWQDADSTEFNGKTGYKVIGSNGNFIFLPCGGWRSGKNQGNLTTYGYIWSSTISTKYDGKTYGWELIFGEPWAIYASDPKQNDVYLTDQAYRYSGANIRPVSGESYIPTSVNSVTTIQPAIRKFYENGQLFIEVDGLLYNASGTRVK